MFIAMGVRGLTVEFDLAVVIGVERVHDILEQALGVRECWRTSERGTMEPGRRTVIDLAQAISQSVKVQGHDWSIVHGSPQRLDARTSGVLGFSVHDGGQSALLSAHDGRGGEGGEGKDGRNGGDGVTQRCRMDTSASLLGSVKISHARDQLQLGRRRAKVGVVDSTAHGPASAPAGGCDVALQVSLDLGADRDLLRTALLLTDRQPLDYHEPKFWQRRQAQATDRNGRAMERRLP